MHKATKSKGRLQIHREACLPGSVICCLHVGMYVRMYICKHLFKGELSFSRGGPLRGQDLHLSLRRSLDLRRMLCPLAGFSRDPVRFKRAPGSKVEGKILHVPMIQAKVLSGIPDLLTRKLRPHLGLLLRLYDASCRPTFLRVGGACSRFVQTRTWQRKRPAWPDKRQLLSTCVFKHLREPSRVFSP